VRVLVTLTYYRPHWTGLTALAARLAEGLAARGHEVTVLAARHDRSLPRHEELAGVRVVRVPTAGRLSRTMVMPGYPAALARLVADHDVVHLHTPMAEALLVAATARARGTPLLVTHQGDVVMPSGPANAVVQRAMDVTLRAALRSADEVVTLGADYARSSPFLRSLGRPVGAIHPPVEIPAPRPEAVARWRRELGLTGRPVVGFAGRFVAEKGFDVLLRAVPAIVAGTPGTHLLFAGDTAVAYEDFHARCGPLFAAAAPHVTELGLLLDRQRLADFYALCDLVVVPSRSDCFAAVQLEALLCGTPLVTSAIPGAREVVTRTGLGWLVPPDDPPALARAVVAALRDPAPPVPTAAAVHDTYSPTESVDRYEAALLRLAERPAPSARPARSAQPSDPSTQPSDPSVRPSDLSVPRRDRSVRPSDPSTQPSGRAVRPPSRLPRPPSRLPRLSARSALPHARSVQSLAPSARPTRSVPPTPGRAELIDTLMGAEADMAYRRRTRWMLNRLDLADGLRVLDAGCGLGSHLRLLDRLHRLDLLGADASPARAARAAREVPAAAVVRADVTHLPLRGASVDRVLASEVLEHLPDDAAGLAELHRVLRPGGLLVLSVPHADYPFWWDPVNRSLEAAGRAPIRRPGPLVGIWTGHERLYRPADLAERVAAAGFVVEEVEEQTHHAFPFSHQLVYGVGKPLLERGLLPASVGAAVGRFPAEGTAPGRGGAVGGAVGAAVAVLRRVDRRNDHLRGDERTFVSVVLRARRA